MVRAGVVDRPDQWPHGSAFELASGRERYRIVDRQKLVDRLGFPDWDTYRQWYDGGARVRRTSLAEVRRPGVPTLRGAFG